MRRKFFPPKLHAIPTGKGENPNEFCTLDRHTHGQTDISPVSALAVKQTTASPIPLGTDLFCVDLMKLNSMGIVEGRRR